MRQICLSVSCCCVKKIIFFLGFVVIKMVKRCWFEMIKKYEKQHIQTVFTVDVIYFLICPFIFVVLHISRLCQVFSMDVFLHVTSWHEFHVLRHL